MTDRGMCWPPRFLGVAPSGQETYALWEPVLDRFLLVAHDVNHLRQLQLLLARKYHPMVVRLECLKHSANLIDNDVCTNWTLDDVSHMSFTDHRCWDLQSDRGVREVGPVTDWPIDQEHEFLIAAYHMLAAVAPDSYSSMWNKHLPTWYRAWCIPYELVTVIHPEPQLLDPDLELVHSVTKEAHRCIYASNTITDLEVAWQASLVKAGIWNQWLGVCKTT